MMTDAEQRDDAEQEVQRLLQEAGLSDAQVDPVSMKALQDLVKTEKSTTPSLTDEDSNHKRNELPPLRQVDAKPPLVQRGVSELTSPLVAGSLDSTREVATDATAAGSSVHGTTEERILDHLQRQTKLLLDLQRRVDELTDEVQQLNGQRPDQPTRTVLQRGLADPPLNNQVRHQPAPQQQQQRAVPQVAVQEQPPQQPAPGLFGRIRAIPEYLQQSRLLKTVRLFVVLRRHQVPGFDAGLLLKILVMLAILTARMSHKHRGDSAIWGRKFFGMTALIIVGFLVQSGYARFIYRFFVKENYPMRIWNGEEIDVGQEIRPERRPAPAAQQQQQQQDQQQPQANVAWRHTLLGGRLEDDPNPPNFVIRFLQDSIVLMGSFFLSIFPMWRPEAPPRPQPPQPQEQDGDGGDDDDFGLPVVRPPEDPAEPEEENVHEHQD